MKLKVIGLGSPHGDDRVGWEVIRLLRSEGLEHLELLELDRPGPALIHYLKDCDKAILIDACDAGWQAGEWRKLTLNELLESAELSGGSSHQLGVAVSLQLASITGEKLPRLDCFLVQIDKADLMAEISPSVDKACKEISSAVASSETG